MRVITRSLISCGVAAGMTVAGLAGVGTPVSGAVAYEQAAGWGPVVNLTGVKAAGSVVPTSVAISSRGKSVAVWVDDNRSTLMAAFRPKDKAWRSPVVVPGSRAAGDGKVGYADDGEAVFAWMTEHAVRVVRRGPQGEWGTPFTVWQGRRSVEARPPNSIELVVNPRGRAAVLFATPAGTLVATGAPDGSWDKPHKLGATTEPDASGVTRVGPTSSSGDAHLAIDRWGRVTVVWREGIWFAGTVMSIVKDPGRSWSSPEALTSRQVVAANPQIAVRGSGQLAVLWAFTRGDIKGLSIARRTRDGEWIRTKALVRNMEWTKLRTAMDGHGTVTVVGQNVRGATWRADHVRGEGWRRMVRVMPRGTAGDEYGLVVNEPGHVMIGSSTPPDVRPVWALRRSPTGVWAPRPTTVSEGRGEVRGPAVAMGPDGTGLLLWAFQRPGTTGTRIQTATFVP